MRNMKMSRILLIFAMVWLAASSCERLEFGDEFLDKPPGVDVTKDTIFNSLELAERYLWNGYRTLPYGLNVNWSAKGNKLGMDILESMTDLVQTYLNWGGVRTQYYSGQYSAATENNATNTKYHYIFEQSWDGIRIGWNFIESANQIPDADPAYIRQLQAEARMIIAVHYVDMYRHFGGLPWVNKAYRPEDDTNLPRMTSRATLDSIVSVIDKAIPDLPWVVDDLSNWDGRFTKAAAMGLKSRILLFGASPLFNSAAPFRQGAASDEKITWHGGYDPALWSRAAAAAKDLIDMVESQGGYALVQTGNPRQDFQNGYYKRGSGETLISTRVRFRVGGAWDGNYYFFQSTWNYGAGLPTKELVDMYDMKESGLPITHPESGYDPNNPWVNRDPRLYETVVVNGDTYQNRTAETYIGGRERPNQAGNVCATGFGIRKFQMERNAATAFNSIVQWPYLRLGEIYLNYAEALNEINGGPTPAAYEAANKLRRRVQMPDLRQGMSQEEFREAILKERATEFAYEEIRWFDLIRWKKEDVFQQKLHGVNTFRNASDGSFSYEVFELFSRYWQDNWDSKWFLSAFPPDEINKGYGLVQNPGWE
jgi:starch-binding outer membrane protein, SusD/RagB family